MYYLTLLLFLFSCFHLEAETALLPPAPLEQLTASTLQKRLQEHIKFSNSSPNRVGYIMIDDRTSGINESTWLYVKQALAYYRKTKPIFIILELNTPGGEVFAAQKISDALKDFDTQEEIPVIAFINNWAISAGAMLAYSCRFITIVKDASMGAAEPVIAGDSGEMKAASEKVNSAIRTDFANRARFFGRNPYIAEAMVDKDIILVLRHDTILKLDSESQIRTLLPEPDILISPKGKLLTLDAAQMMEYGVADLLLLPKKLEPITLEEQEKGNWPAHKALLFQNPYFSQIPEATIDRYQMDWKTRFFVFLAHPIVSSLLLMGLMMGLYLEFSSPGIGLPATLALGCLFLIIISYLSLDIANWLEVILLVTGLAIIIIDLFFLPTFGLLGGLGALLFLGGLFGIMLPELGSVSFDPNSHSWNEAGKALLIRLSWLSAALVASLFLIALLSRYVTPITTAWTKLVLTGSEQVGYSAGENPLNLPKVGEKGIAFSSLRLTGKVLINGSIFDAVSSGTFIEKGTAVVVSRLEGSVIFVDTSQ